VGWGGEWEKVKTCGLRLRQFNRKAKEEIIIICTKQVMNKSNCSLPEEYHPAHP